MFLEDAIFPTNISYGSTGGPQYKTTITIVNSGYEYNNIDWDQSKHSYNVSMGVRTREELTQLIQFFHIVRGRGHSFRYKDWSDYKSCNVENDITALDQIIGYGNGVTTDFQLIKTYDLSFGILNERIITKPVSNTILIAKDGVLQTAGTHYSLNAASGLVSFNTPPELNSEITWGGEFHVPCRFDIDKLDINLSFFDHGNLDVIPVVEIRV